MLYITFTSLITGAQSKLQDAKVAFGTNQLLPTWLLGWVGVQGGVKISMESSITSLRAFNWLTCQNKVQSHSRSSLLVTNTEILSAKCYLGLMFLCYLSVGAEPDPNQWIGWTLFVLHVHLSSCGMQIGGLLLLK